MNRRGFIRSGVASALAGLAAAGRAEGREREDGGRFPPPPPLSFRDEKSGSYVTQYYKDDVEQAGLVKFDFLGLKTLTVLDIAVKLINARPDYKREDKRLDLSRIPMDDKPTFALLARSAIVRQ